MSIAQLSRVIGTTGVVVVVPLVTAMAQTQPNPPSPAIPPAATQPPPSAPPAAPTDKKAGASTAIGVKVGGFLGFGGHMVIIPDGRFNRVGDTVQINMTSDEVHKLPEAKKKS